ncbi:pseudouridine-5'-phosphate glycosidase [Desertibaculum subflavum]|uniref:pseudouridine-5'-phosphate glycosidase n=1 Tax=Desertibaculum subflavum TaxID=2268458 RepID=UPI000E66C9C5
MSPSPLVHLAPAVADALAAGRPVVALESSIIAHGFPPPQNRALADELAATVTAAGAVPAMIAVISGELRVGLDADALDLLVRGNLAKASARDLGPLIAAGVTAGTTVAATARIAALAGIKVFATGGIGGVHRRLPNDSGPPDISADLAELGRTTIAVVTAGAKSILDLPATVEMLETLGIGVIGYGTAEFPAFHSRESGLPLAHRVDGIAPLAAAVRAHLHVAGTAMLVCNPPPAAIAVPWAELSGWIEAALQSAGREGVSGQRVTPHLLAALNRFSGGRSQAVNRALALDNATLAAKLAVAL